MVLDNTFVGAFPGPFACSGPPSTVPVPFEFPSTGRVVPVSPRVSDHRTDIPSLDGVPDAVPLIWANSGAAAETDPPLRMETVRASGHSSIEVYRFRRSLSPIRGPRFRLLGVVRRPHPSIDVFPATGNGIYRYVFRPGPTDVSARRSRSHARRGAFSRSHARRGCSVRYVTGGRDRHGTRFDPRRRPAPLAAVPGLRHARRTVLPRERRG